MESKKEIQKKTLDKGSKKMTPSVATITPAKGGDFEEILEETAGMWADREELQDVKDFRRNLWRRKQTK